MDPTYVVRAVPANEYDCNLCAKLAESAVHCAFGGYTNFSVGMINNKPCMIPLIKMCEKSERKIQYNSEDYLMLLASTGQPSFYPEGEIEQKTEDIKEDKKEEEHKPKESGKNNDKSEINTNLKKGSIDFGDKENQEKKSIFDFH